MKTFKSLLSAVLIVILICTMSISAFAYNDVDSASENYKAIEFVDKLGIIQSTWGGDFQPEQYFTRADTVIAAYKMLYGEAIDPTVYESTGLEFNVSSSGDIEDGSLLASYLAWAVDNYLITTNVGDSMFRPAEPVTANELITVLAKLLKLVEDPEAIYPDAYTDAFGELAGEIEPGDNPVTREQAAVLISNALVCSEDGKPGEIGIYEDFDGTPHTSLAVKAQHMSAIDLVIRATTSRKLGYDVKNGVLLSNGMDVALSEDLSDYVGYGITVTYRDNDSSKTLTEDEQILAYSVGSATSATIPSYEVTVSSGNSISVNIDGNSYNINTSTFMYLNDNLWPIGNDDYDLTKVVAALGADEKIQSRPNFLFKCMYTSGASALTSVFATETRPGKIVGVNNGIYSVFDYYKANSQNAVSHYAVTDCSFSSTVKVGDYVNFYEAGGKCYFTPGTTIVSSLVSREGGSEPEYMLASGANLKEHAFFTFGKTPLVEGKEAEITFIVEDSGENYMLTWENYQTNHAGLFVKSISSDNATATHTITAVDGVTNKEVIFKVLYTNVDSATPIVAGDYINYSDNGGTTEQTEGAKPLVTYVSKNTKKLVLDYTMPAGVTNYIVDNATGNIYYINKVCTNVPASGTAQVVLDIANTVVKLNII